MTGARGVVQVGWCPSVADVASAVAPVLGGIGASPVHLVPSTMSRTDTAVQRLRSSLRHSQVRTSLLLPRSAAISVVSRHGGEAWRSIDVNGRAFRLDRRISEAPYVAVTIIDDAQRSGPFVLDLPSHFLHPIDWLRLAAYPDRLQLLAGLAAKALPKACLMLTPVAAGWLIVMTSDTIAAELWSLALAERFLDQRLEMQGPWEDPTVQRATELELGVRIPQEMTMVTLATEPIPAAAHELQFSVASRLGMSRPAE